MTVLSTWTSEAQGPVLGCGVDVERVVRFRTTEGPESDPWSLLFTEREVSHCRSLAEMEVGLCASFCAKEALLKAVSVPIDYRSCELLFLPDVIDHQLFLSPELCAEHGISEALARVVHFREHGECIVAVVIFGRS